MRFPKLGMLLLLFAAVCLRATLAMATTIPPDVKKVVAFVFLADDKGQLALNKDGNPIPNGTGFFVSLPKPDTQYVNVYFVTAKHVIRRNNTGPFYNHVFIRLNKLDGTWGFVRLILFGAPQQTTFFHPDPSVDLAVVPVGIDQKVFDYKFIPRDYITSKDEFEKLTIVEGTDVFFAGLFTPYLGEKRNYPVVRFGKVALVTDEQIPWDGKKMDLYLMESGS